MKRCFSAMTAQQAPTPFRSRQAWVWLFSTDQTALMMPHSTKPMAQRTTK